MILKGAVYVVCIFAHIIILFFFVNPSRMGNIKWSRTHGHGDIETACESVEHQAQILDEGMQLGQGPVL